MTRRPVNSAACPVENCATILQRTVKGGAYGEQGTIREGLLAHLKVVHDMDGQFAADLVAEWLPTED